MQWTKDHLPLAGPALNAAWKLEVLRQLGNHCTGRVCLTKGFEYRAHTRLDARIRVQHHCFDCVVGQPYWQWNLKCAALGFVALAAQQPRFEQMQLCLAHRALQAEQQTVIKVRRVVDAIFIADQTASERTYFQQPLPVGVVASKSRNLKAQQNTRMTDGNLTDQPLEPVALLSIGGCAALIVVNRVDAFNRPPERHRLIT
jgi:hypothetical protein